MAKEIDFETYLSISKNKFEIFLFDNKSLKSSYQNELKLESSIIDLEKLSKFLDENIFKIEKFAGKFIENIFLMIESNENLEVNICIKKKNYDKLINKNTLSEVKDLFKEAYQDQIIMHMIINNYLINGKNYNLYIDNLRSDNLCLEVNFLSISNNMSIALGKILEKYQIKIKQYLNTRYIKNFTKVENIKIPEMANMLKNGYNNNEVILVPKNKENKGFFEKFFQLFS